MIFRPQLSSWKKKRVPTPASMSNPLPGDKNSTGVNSRKTSSGTVRGSQSIPTTPRNPNAEGAEYPSSK